MSKIVCLDLEGVLIPEIWQLFAQKTGIEILKITTRDIPDYGELMALRLQTLAENQLSLADVQSVLAEIEPLEGAVGFLQAVREQLQAQVVILSDTFYEFARPIMPKLGNPTLFCHSLEHDEQGRCVGYQLRLEDHKTQAVKAFQALNFTVYAVGDSYNDLGMLAAADKGVLFNAPQEIEAQNPMFECCDTYQSLLERLELEADSGSATIDGR
ncbi:MAG: bifunctional phosphoserine phosphatase/homoserine phosphotransferase ThrH [Cellvibrionaceae bacterium]